LKPVDVDADLVHVELAVDQRASARSRANRRGVRRGRWTRGRRSPRWSDSPRRSSSSLMAGRHAVERPERPAVLPPLRSDAFAWASTSSARHATTARILGERRPAPGRPARATSCDRLGLARPLRLRVLIVRYRLEVKPGLARGGGMASRSIAPASMNRPSRAAAGPEHARGFLEVLLAECRQPPSFMSFGITRRRATAFSRSATTSFSIARTCRVYVAAGGCTGHQSLLGDIEDPSHVMVSDLPEFSTRTVWSAESAVERGDRVGRRRRIGEWIPGLGVHTCARYVSPDGESRTTCENVRERRYVLGVLSSSIYISVFESAACSRLSSLWDVPVRIANSCCHGYADAHRRDSRASCGLAAPLLVVVPHMVVVERREVSTWPGLCHSVRVRRHLFG